MPIRNASQFLDALKDDRDISIEGERVRDIAGDPRFAGAARAMARLMEMQHEPGLHEIMTYESPDTGDPVGMTHLQPRTKDEVAARNDAIKVWMDESCGMLGRSPDFKNVMISAYATAGERFDREAFKGGDNIRDFHRHVRENDLITTHVLVNPQVDRSRPAHLETSDVIARIVGETDAGFVDPGRPHGGDALRARRRASGDARGVPLVGRDARHHGVLLRFRDPGVDARAPLHLPPAGGADQRALAARPSAVAAIRRVRRAGDLRRRGRAVGAHLHLPRPGVRPARQPAIPHAAPTR